MAEVAIVNASPLIFLSKAGLLELLRLIAPQVAVPDAVANEIVARGQNDITAKALSETSWLFITPVNNIPPLIQSWDLGAGESAVLAYAKQHQGAVAIIDDGAGRRCAEVLGVPVSGTLGLVLTAKRRGVIPIARPVIEKLKKHGMYLSEKTIQQALTLVGE